MILPFESASVLLVSWSDLPAEDSVQGKVVLLVLGMAYGDDLLETLQEHTYRLQRNTISSSRHKVTG